MVLRRICLMYETQPPLQRAIFVPATGRYETFINKILQLITQSYSGTFFSKSTSLIALKTNRIDDLRGSDGRINFRRKKKATSGVVLCGHYGVESVFRFFRFPAVADDFVELGSFAARELACGGKHCDAKFEDLPAPPQNYFITDAKRARGLGGSVVDKDCARVAQLLRDCAAQTQTAGFEK
jgi:hypothetical protein